MLQALWRTATEMADSKKAGYSFLASIMLAVLIVWLHVDATTAGIIVGPLVVGALGQAHVDAQAAKAKGAPVIAGPVIGELKTGAPFETETRPGD